MSGQCDGCSNNDFHVRKGLKPPILVCGEASHSLKKRHRSTHQRTTCRSLLDVIRKCHLGLVVPDLLYAVANRGTALDCFRKRVFDSACTYLIDSPLTPAYPAGFTVQQPTLANIASRKIDVRAQGWIGARVRNSRTNASGLFKRRPR